MKSKKLFIPTIVIASTVVAIIIFSIISSVSVKPKITEGEFPFSITYKIDGETVTIDDVYRAYYVENGGYADTKSRIYEGEIGDMGEGNTVYTIKRGENTRVELYTNFYADYVMGDSEYDYFDYEPFEPKIYYYDSQEQEYDDEQTLSEQGVKLVSFEYPKPIKNSFSFSHLSYFSCAVVLPTILIALLGLVATFVFVKRDKEAKRKVIDIISIVLNFVIGFTVIPFVSILAFFIDIEGGGPELYYQLMYFIPALSILAIALSIGLRRRGYGKSALITEFIGPAAFGIYLFVFYVIENL